MPGFDEKQYERDVWPAIRTLFHNESRMPDEFLRYGIDLTEDNTESIKAVVDSVHKYWAKKFNHPRDGALFKKLHGDKAVREAVENPEKRQQLRTKITDDRRVAEKARFAELDSWILMASADGYLTTEAISHLVSVFTAKGIIEAEIRARVARIPVQAASKAESLEEGLPATVRKQIQTSLSVLQNDDLYQFLLVPAGASKEQWRSQYSAKVASTRASSADHKTAAANALLGIIKTHIIDGDPAGYAKARVFSLAERLEPQVKLAGTGGPITQEKYEALVAQAIQMGLPGDDGPKVIRWLAAKQGLAVSVATERVNTFTTLCSVCGSIVQADKAPEHCPKCRSSLWTKCPECTSRVLVSSAACGQCGFPINRSATVDGLLKVGQNALSAGDLEEAILCLRGLEAIWITGRTLQYRQEVQRAIGAAEDTYQKFLTSEADHRLVAAREIINRLRGLGPNFVFRDGVTVSKLEDRLATKLTELNKHLDEARRFVAAASPVNALLAYESARAISHDSEEAIDGLSRIPPEPASDLQASIGINSVQLNWEPSKALGSLEYAVVYHNSHAPESASDGVGAGTVKTLALEDRGVQNGELRYYSVFAKRGSAYSTAAKTAAVFAALEVRKFTLTSNDREVAGSWDPLPSNAKAVVTRAEAGSTDIQKVVGDSGGFRDTPPATGKSYDYRIHVEYLDAKGQAIRTRGIAQRVTWEAPPEPVAELSVKPEGSFIEVSWTSPPRGTVHIYALDKDPGIKFASRLNQTDLASWKNRLTPSSANSALAQTAAGRIVYLVPVTVLGDWAVAGNVLRFVDIPDITGLTAQHFGKYIELQWTWPPSCNLTLVAWRKDRFAITPDDLAAQKQELPRASYNLIGGFKLEQPAAQDYYFTVFSGVVTGNARMFSGGQAKGCRAHVAGSNAAALRYSISKSRWSRSRELIVESEAELLPELVLVLRRDGIQPLNANEGEIVVRLPAGTPLAPRNFTLSGSGYLRLFCADPAQSKRYQINDPDPRQLKVT